MAWSWSHSPEAYESIEIQLNNKGVEANNGDTEAIEWLHTVWSEFVASNWKEDRVTTDLDLRKYQRAIARAKRQGAELGYNKLAADIWNWSSELATCTNGGWNAWCCPFGCHLIPFNVKAE